MTEEKKKQSSQFAIAVAIFVVIIAVLVIANQSGGGTTVTGKNTYVPKPNVRVGDYDFDFKLSLSKGYYGLFNGVVVNSGDATGRDVRLRCLVKRDGRVIGSEERYLGTLSAGQTQLFEMDVDFKGSSEVRGSCTASCSNC